MTAALASQPLTRRVRASCEQGATAWGNELTLVIPGYPDVVRPQVDPIAVALVEELCTANCLQPPLYLARWPSSQSTFAMGRAPSGMDPLAVNLRAA